MDTKTRVERTRVERAQQGDPEAMAALYASQSTRLYNIATHYSLNNKNLLQKELMVRAIKDLSGTHQRLAQELSQWWAGGLPLWVRELPQWIADLPAQELERLQGNEPPDTSVADDRLEGLLTWAKELQCLAIKERIKQASELAEWVIKLAQWWLLNPRRTIPKTPQLTKGGLACAYSCGPEWSHSVQDKEAVVADTLYEVFNGIERFQFKQDGQGDGGFQSWVTTVYKSKCYDAVVDSINKGWACREQLNSDGDGTELADPPQGGASPEEWAENEKRVCLVREFVDKIRKVNGQERRERYICVIRTKLAGNGKARRSSRVYDGVERFARVARERVARVTIRVDVNDVRDCFARDLERNLRHDLRNANTGTLDDLPVLKQRLLDCFDGVNATERNKALDNLHKEMTEATESLEEELAHIYRKFPRAVKQMLDGKDEPPWGRDIIRNAIQGDNFWHPHVRFAARRAPRPRNRLH